MPSEESSGDRRRLGHITKQGNSLVRFLLVEAAQVSEPWLAWRFFHESEMARSSECTLVGSKRA